MLTNEIFDAPVPATSNGGNSIGGGGSAGNNGRGDGGGHLELPNHFDQGEKHEKKECELEPEVCVKPISKEVSANYELKCEGLPPIVVSTTGKTGLKIGPLELSFSPNK
jgi:hypothetical protein